jgi:hypothetical protein
MKHWIEGQIGRDLDAASGVVVILDPDAVLTPPDVDDIADHIETKQVISWLELRRLWDLDIRRRSGVARAAILVRSSEFATPTELPWDIEHEACAVLRVRWPVPSELRALFRVSGDHADDLAEATARNLLPGATIAAAYAIRTGSTADELEAVVRLRCDPSTPPELWEALESVFLSSLACQIAHDRGGLDFLQAAWNDWLAAGEAAAEADELASAPGPILALLGSGLLTPAPAAVAFLPSWVSVGTALPDPNVLVEELLEIRPSTPLNVVEWIETASWWGHVRSAIAAQPNPSAAAEKAWRLWDDLDAEFSEWLHAAYGGNLLSSAATPRAVHQIAPFLARRVDAGAHILLIVIDGLGFAQWHQLRSASRLKVVEATGCLAMLPTLTTISRQAIFAGALPVDFAETLATTSAEVPPLRGTVVAVVVNAIDEMLHGAEVLGDRQVAVGVDLWARTGFLDALVSRGTTQGYEVWITSDHGNLPTVPTEVPKEGQTVELAGTRVRMYPNEILRHAAAEFGVIWDPPGYPRLKPCPLFARGRTGFHSKGSRVSHGGLSLDEVIIPLVQVTD